MPAPQRPMRRAPQMRKTMPSRATPFQRCADASRPVSGQTGHVQATPGEPARSIPPTLVRRCPRSPGIAPTNRRQPGKVQHPTRPATCRIRVFPAAQGDSAPHFSRRPRFRRLRADRRASPNALFEATFIRVRSAGLQFSARPRSSRAQRPPAGYSKIGFHRIRPFPAGLGSGAHIPAPAMLPFPARIPTSPPRSALPLVPASDPPRFPRAFSCAFPALLPHFAPPFCASFVKKHHEACARCAKPLQRRASSRTAPRFCAATSPQRLPPVTGRQHKTTSSLPP